MNYFPCSSENGSKWHRVCLFPYQGGSWVSTGDEASRFARFAFRRHFFQHLGFRIAQSVVDRPPVRLVETPVFVLGVGVEGKLLQ